jgi:hypothetical protein
MHWTSFLLTVVAAGVAASFTDWLFMGVLFHDKYNAHPEIWRKPPGSPDSALILFSTALGLVATVAFAALCWRLGLHGYARTLKFALGVWAAGPLPVIVTNALWIKFHPSIAVSHALGWLARLSATAIAATLLLK